jgi:NAD(P)H-flavin reductase
VFNSDLYIPRAAVVEKIDELTRDTRLYRIKFMESSEDGDGNESDYRPGQFVQISILGAGEVPISICSSPAEQGYLELCIRNTGAVTAAIHRLSEGDEVGIRGPYGSCFGLDELRGSDLVFIGGGIGLPPLRSAIKHVLANRSDYGDVIILYGARTMEDIILAHELEEWGRQPQVQVFTTIDTAQEGWDGHVGVVTTLFDRISHAFGYKAIVCGPSLMIHYVVYELLKAGWAAQDIIMTLERHMKCGVGKCGHCYLGDKYACVDGPVFTCEQLESWGVEV